MTTTTSPIHAHIDELRLHGVRPNRWQASWQATGSSNASNASLAATVWRLPTGDYDHWYASINGIVLRRADGEPCHFASMWHGIDAVHARFAD